MNDKASQHYPEAGSEVHKEVLKDRGDEQAGEPKLSTEGV